jgi:hypothetical protein
MTSDPHHGVNEADLRNRGVIERFRPQEVTAESARATLAKINPDPIQVEERVAKLMADLASKPHRPPPPLSWTLEESPDPHFSTHPDIVSQLWRLDRALPQSCRWLVWGYPALVHPRTGVIFAIAFGTIGAAVRLPPDRLDGALATRRHGSDIAAAGPEWRFLSGESQEALCRAAHDFAGVEVETSPIGRGRARR